MEDAVPFASREYFIFLALLFTGRGADFFSTWIATPNLILEGNPIAKKLGWKLGLVLNVALCFVFARYPLSAIILVTTSLLVAARNFQNAWLMRTLGEEGYRAWFIARMTETHFGLYLLCLFAQTAIFSAVGFCLVYFAENFLIPYGIGLGIIGYAFVVLFFTLLSVWRIRR